MRLTGMTRPVDNTGRICLPKEIRDKMGLKAYDRLEMYVDGDKLILQSDVKKCNCCENEADKEVLGINLCWECIKDLKNKLK